MPQLIRKPVSRVCGLLLGTALLNGVPLRADTWSAQRIGSITNISGPLTDIGGELYLSGYDATNGYELRKLNATDSDVDLVKDLTAGTGGTTIDRITKVGDKVFFRATVGGSGIGQELYVTDGTSAGTGLVKDIRTGSNVSSSIDNLAAFGSTLFFTANDGSNGNELWSSDGTSAGTSLFKDFRPATNDSSASASSFTALNVGGTDYLYFRSTTSAAGSELWRTDGTAAGTTQVADLYAGATGSNPTELTAAGSGFYLSASNGFSGLFFCNGSTVTSIKPISVGSPSNLAYIGGNLYFTAYQAGAGEEPWISDGTTAGTNMIKDLGSEFNGNSNPSGFTGTEHGVIFQAGVSLTGHELYVTDGSSSGTSLLKDINPGTATGISNAAAFTRCGDSVYFAANDGVHGNELWVTDGTADGTCMALDMYPGSGNGFPIGITYMVNLNGTLYFKAYDGVSTNLYKLVTTCDSMTRTMTSRERAHMSSRSSHGLGSGSTLRFEAASSAYTCSLAYRERTSLELPLLLSDVLAVSGSGSTPFLLQLECSADVQTALGATRPMLGWFHSTSNTWVNAILGNTGMTGLSQNEIDALYVAGPYTDGLALGSWGFDSATHVVWALLDHNSEFAATPLPPTSAYGSWIDRYFSGSVDPALIDASADPDGDGLANSIEYVLGTSPADSLQSRLPTLTQSADTMTYHYIRSKAAGAAGFVTTVQYSSTLAAEGWTTATPAMTTITDSGTEEIIDVLIPLPTPATSLFARLCVSSL